MTILHTDGHGQTKQLVKTTDYFDSKTQPVRNIVDGSTATPEEFRDVLFTEQMYKGRKVMPLLHIQVMRTEEKHRGEIVEIETFGYSGDDSFFAYRDEVMETGGSLATIITKISVKNIARNGKQYISVVFKAHNGIAEKELFNLILEKRTIVADFFSDLNPVPNKEEKTVQQTPEKQKPETPDYPEKTINPADIPF